MAKELSQKEIVLGAACSSLVPAADGVSQPRHTQIALRDLELQGLASYRDGWRLTEEGRLLAAATRRLAKKTLKPRYKGKTPKQWVSLHDRMSDPPECEYKHEGCSCSKEAGGPCLNEMLLLDPPEEDLEAMRQARRRRRRRS